MVKMLMGVEGVRVKEMSLYGTFLSLSLWF